LHLPLSLDSLFSFLEFVHGVQSNLKLFGLKKFKDPIAYGVVDHKAAHAHAGAAGQALAVMPVAFVDGPDAAVALVAHGEAPAAFPA
jgi:hypothetical protein